MPHSVNVSRVWNTRWYVSTKARPPTTTSRNAARPRPRSTASRVIPVARHGDRSEWMNRKYSGHRLCWWWWCAAAATSCGGGDDGDGEVLLLLALPPPQLKGMGTRSAAGDGTW